MLQQLERLHAVCFPHKPWTAADFMDLKKSGCDIIASENGFIVYRVVADEAEIVTIGVAPDARRGGVAAAMLAIAEQDAKKRGAAKMFLEVATDNTAARALYRAAGYSEVGVRPKYYDGVDAILMARQL
ncbi:MAG: ribosomal protein S18-alanine N-acetyltransferase [Alphaproteobacteria bacterium]|nr:ribosomal protein S18-alanine N-acetyltransferase [Alphaproteobacteria bacterium]